MTGTVPTSLDPWREQGIPLDKQFRSWRERIKAPYDKQDVDPYSRCRVILMNGLEAADLENVLLAETKDHADWRLLQQLAAQADDPTVRAALEELVPQVEAEEDEHLSWARDTLGERTLRRVLHGPAAPPARWQRLLSGQEPPLAAIHPAPATEGLLPPSEVPQWADPPALRELQATAPPS